MNISSILTIILVVSGVISAFIGSDWFWASLIIIPLLALNNIVFRNKNSFLSNEGNLGLMTIVFIGLLFGGMMVDSGSFSLGEGIIFLYVLIFLLSCVRIITSIVWIILLFVPICIISALYITSPINTYMTNIYKANEAKRIVYEQSVQDKIKNVNISIIKKAKEDHTTIPIFSGSFMKIHSYGTATGSDDVVIYLKQIERENQYNQQFIKDVENIQIHNGYIELMGSGITINRYRGMMHPKMEDIYFSSGNTLLLWSDKNKKSNPFTRENFDTFSSNIPGSGSLEKKQNLAKFLNLRYE